MPSFNSILREYPDGSSKNTDEEDEVSSASKIEIPRKADGSSRLKGTDFCYTEWSEGAPKQGKAFDIKGSFPSIDSPTGTEEQGSEVKRRSSDFKERNKKASLLGEAHSDTPAKSEARKKAGGYDV